MYLRIIIFICFYLNLSANANSPEFSQLSSFLNHIDTVISQAQTLVKPLKEHPGPIDCFQILKTGKKESGIYRIWPLNWETVGSFNVYCDMETDGGGWTVFQRRGDYNNLKDYFFKHWEDYRRGFGNINSEFWLGNDRLFSLTNQGNYSLRIDMKDENRCFATYQEFWIENENHFYTLHVSTYSGDAGDSFSNMDGMKFSTRDKDNDNSRTNCANIHKGGWWYNSCHESNLNGLNLRGPYRSNADGISWLTWKGDRYSIRYVDMKIRPSFIKNK